MTATAAEPVEIEMWTDLVCPWCYVGKHRLQAAIDQRPDKDRFTVRFRSFELDPAASHAAEPLADAFSRSKGVPKEQFLKMETGVQDMAQGEGLEYSMERQLANTFDVHRLLQFAETQGIGTAFFSAIQDAYFAGRLDPFDTEQLVEASVAVGLSEESVRGVLADDQGSEAVRSDESAARELGVTGVPFTVFGRRFAAAGAQSVEGYAAALEQIAPLPAEA